MRYGLQEWTQDKYTMFPVSMGSGRRIKADGALKLARPRASRAHVLRVFGPIRSPDLTKQTQHGISQLIFFLTSATSVRNSPTVPGTRHDDQRKLIVTLSNGDHAQINRNARYRPISQRYLGSRRVNRSRSASCG